MGDFDKQNSFLYGQIQCFAPKRCMVAIPGESRRQYSFAFYVKDSNGVDIRVCKAAFLSVFGLQNSRGSVNNIMTQITRGDGTPIRQMNVVVMATDPVKLLTLYVIR